MHEHEEMLHRTKIQVWMKRNKVILWPVGDVKHSSLIGIFRWFSLWGDLAFHLPNAEHNTLYAGTSWTGEEEMKSYFYFMILSHVVQCKSHGCQSKNNARYLNTFLWGALTILWQCESFSEQLQKRHMSPGGHLGLRMSHPPPPL